MNFHTFYLSKEEFTKLLSTTRLRPTISLLGERKIEFKFNNSKTGIEFIEETQK